ncbi:SDR family NAD(P)-dependent oxidoreductase [Actinoplanes sp. NPDC051851]|uniref:SDR family NAD(P)-dependent oxidoreductase n=1 Tax=Actinoplanes sp. NPDC051851 TaxID=3154753 RepID=UPI00342C4942
MRLSEKTAVITGGTTGIGLATARRFLAEGARVIITGQNQDRLTKARAELGAGENLATVRADIRVIDDLDALAARAAERFGGHLDVLFANAGVAALAAVPEVTPEQFDEQVAVNLRGLFFTVQRLLPLLGSAVTVDGGLADL